MIGWIFRRRSGTRLLGLLVFRNEMRFLPGYFASLGPQVDGVVALDDGSSDGSTEFVARRSEVLELVRLPARPDAAWDDGANHRRLVEAAWRHDAEWLVAVDADERLEVGFRRRVERLLAAPRGPLAYYLHVREVWDKPEAFRVDGVWGRKRSARLFAARRDHQFDANRLHGHWAPLNSRLPSGDFAQADLFLYHLRMLRAEDRAARRARYEALDPERRFQQIGYSYLTATEGMELRSVPWRRRYRPLF